MGSVFCRLGGVGADGIHRGPSLQALSARTGRSLASACGKPRTFTASLYEWGGAQSLRLRGHRVEIMRGEICWWSWVQEGGWNLYLLFSNTCKPEGWVVEELVVQGLRAISLDWVFTSDLSRADLALGCGLTLGSALLFTWSPCVLHPSFSWLVPSAHGQSHFLLHIFFWFLQTTRDTSRL